jgi:hypothetical protein
MDKSGPWTPVPLRVALAQPGGPVEQGFFKGLLAELGSGLKAALPVDGVFVACHGAALAEGTDDPDGDLFEMIARSSPGRADGLVRPARQRLAPNDRQPLGVLVATSRTPMSTSASAASRPPSTCANTTGQRTTSR